MRCLVAEHVASLGSHLGEGPCWDALGARLLCVDVNSGRLWSVDSAGQVSVVIEVDGVLSAALPAASGAILLVGKGDFSVLPVRGRPIQLLPVFGQKAGVRFNDAKCDLAGRCLAGTMSLTGATADGQLLRLDSGPAATVLLNGVGLSNGLGWSPDGGIFYFTDTLAGRVDRFDYDAEAGTLGVRTTLVDVSPENPDGLCVDADGCIWVAFWGGGIVRRYDPNGRLDTVVKLPVPNVTSCAFGDSDGGTLYITTAIGDLRPGETPALRAGDLFAIRGGASAPPATAWAGVA